MNAHHFMSKFHLFFFLGIRKRKSTNLISMLNSSSLFTYFSIQLCCNSFNIFVDVVATIFSEVA